MSYATMPTFEGNYFGVRRLSTLGNAGHMLGALGDITGDSAAAVAAGVIDQGTANFLIAAGATDQDFINLLNGSTDVATLMTRYTTGNAAGSQLPGTPSAGIFSPVSPVAPGAPGTSAQTGIPSTQAPPINPTIAPTPPPGASSGTPAYSIPAQTPAQVPAGSTLTFTAAWTSGISNLFVSTSAAIASMTSGLAKYGISVMSSSPVSNGPINYGIQLVCTNSVAFAQFTQAQSIFNSLIQSIVGNNLSSTPQLVLTALGGQPGPGVTPTVPQTTAQWLEANAGYIGAGVAAIAIVAIVWGGRR
ncbi:MAG: hypothetical protein WCA19_14735 [Candidatus Acidiferrales bacterium]